MARFANKTQHELRIYFKRLSLEQLKEQNRAYGPHFDKLEDNIDTCILERTEATQTKIKLQGQKANHELTYDAVLLSEQSYKQNLESVCDISDPTERFLARQAVGISPLDIYNDRVSNFVHYICSADSTIERLTNRINSFTEKKRAAISELKILNHVISEKEQLINVPSYGNNRY